MLEICIGSTGDELEAILTILTWTDFDKSSLTSLGKQKVSKSHYDAGERQRDILMLMIVEATAT